MQYVTRAQAGLRQPRSRQSLGRVSALWLHHEGGPRRTGTDEAAAWRAIQAYSMDALGYADTDYSFGVGLSGTIYEGRGWGVMSAATLNNNATSYSICAIGNFEIEEPTDALLRGIADVCRDGIARGFLTPGSYPTGGHRDAPNMGGFSTSCPGRNLEAALPTIRSYVSAPGAPVQEVPDLDATQDKLLHECHEMLSKVKDGTYVIRPAEGVNTSADIVGRVQDSLKTVIGSAGDTLKAAVRDALTGVDLGSATADEIADAVVAKFATRLDAAK